MFRIFSGNVQEISRKLPENFHPAAYIDTDGHVDWDLLVSDSQSGLVGVAYLLFSFFESLEAVDTQHY